jgi:hypothetical protein
MTKVRFQEFVLIQDQIFGTGFKVSFYDFFKIFNSVNCTEQFYFRLINYFSC